MTKKIPLDFDILTQILKNEDEVKNNEKEIFNSSIKSLINNS